ncbi:hypothetical protein POM88_007383 [Heracleum sosnowskyi]|uniref:Uncharacterized protein n=1 Tax=Heracleum sosnowskyi TaxID=360622 RepID=A0AAD8J4A7_9APIA|nr:hypothetical protein POM88_007383 [Heracleum sosnowskyi]
MSDGLFGANSYVFKLVRRHMHDWLTLLLLGVIDGLLNLIEPFHRYLSEEMLTPDIKYPYQHDTIPMWSMQYVNQWMGVDDTAGFLCSNRVAIISSAFLLELQWDGFLTKELWVSGQE